MAKKQLYIGMSEERTYANYIAVSKVYSKYSIITIFAFTILGYYITDSLLGVMGLSLSILIVVAFSKYTIEAIYASYLLNTNKSYCQKIPEEHKNKRNMYKYLKNSSRRLSTYTKMVSISLALFVFYEMNFDLPKRFQMYLDST